MKRKGLGRGLGALIQDTQTNAAPEASEADANHVLHVAVDSVRANRWQPRHAFGEEELEELTASIRRRGILQPLLVRRSGDGYELIAGERRLRAARQAGLTEVPVLVTETGDEGALEIALIENLQREDLNIVDEAEGYRVLGEKFGLTQEQIAERVGKGRASIANALRLLGLPQEVKALLSSDRLSAGHAKVLSGLEMAEEQLQFARMAVAENLSVRNLEDRIQKAHRPRRKPRTQRSDLPADHVSYLSDRLHSHFGTRVRLVPCKTYANGKKGKGSIEIDFYSNEELDRLLSLLGLNEE